VRHVAITRIQVQKVTRLFGATAALRGVSCVFEAGVATFVQGGNGAGKSTLLAIVGTVLRPTSGEVIYGSGLTREQARREIGWVGHESHCYSELTGRENVELAARILGHTDTAAVSRACERIRAERFFDQPVGSLSRGQRQRVALARALVGAPSVLLLDEPLTGLDAETVKHFDDVLAAEQERGAVVVVVSHTPGWAERLGAREVLLDRGRIVPGG
jgi:ABC-type multidrug transport system ATPase subunit